MALTYGMRSEYNHKQVAVGSTAQAPDVRRSPGTSELAISLVDLRGSCPHAQAGLVGSSRSIARAQLHGACSALEIRRGGLFTSEGSIPCSGSLTIV